MEDNRLSSVGVLMITHIRGAVRSHLGLGVSLCVIPGDNNLIWSSSLIRGTVASMMSICVTMVESDEGSKVDYDIFALKIVCNLNQLT